ncbi:hypothetical protein COUCH_11445 [Couchioplanes caeruleus]|uniref:hypothetical protein n=1 Tax=Couchioplanes caeruleus TaxID=56438 RepID=UPI0020BEBFA8|nr:hypothetical protein [Couchioplanes caeruleus]UQU66837.1 hypothetical protein COUCH_11445 [Couchioplanes caeruleus]
MTSTSPVILVGDRTDPHIQAVADLLPARGTVIVDAATLSDGLESVEPSRTVLVDQTGGTVDVGPGCPARGWLRRLAPAGWDHGTVLGGHDAAVLSARLVLLAALLRDSALTLVTPVDELFAAENKLVQYRAAREIGVRYPTTLVSGDVADLVERLDELFVLKPLGPGNFEDDRRQNVVYVRPVYASDVAGADLLDAPFLAQQLIHAEAHLRVVTVHDRVWVTELDGTGVPVDWREHAPAHHSFQVSTAWPEVANAAGRLAAHLRVGFSSQDWVVDDDGPAFLDLNPGGQWLFLPDTVTTSVAQALADWLADR